MQDLRAAADDTRPSLFRLSAFASPNVAIGALLMALSIYLPRFYAGPIGLGLPAVGVAVMSVRLVDLFVDPFVGLGIDRTRSRFGRYRPWFVAGAPLLIGAVYMLFNPAIGASFGYLVVWTFLFYLGASFIVLALYSWAARLTADYHQRSRVFGTLQVLFVCGATAAILLPILTTGSRDSGGSATISAMGLFGMVATAIGVVLLLAFVPEPPAEPGARGKVPLKLYWRMVARPDMRRIIISDFCLELGYNWMSALYLFYFHDALAFTIAQASILLLAYIAAGLVGATALSFAATRFGKHRTLMSASAGYAMGLAGLGMLPAGDMWLGGIFMFIMGFLQSGFPLLNRAMVADVGDAIRLEYGIQNVGLLYAMLSTDQKVARALSIGLPFIVLGALGYKAQQGALNTHQAIGAMEVTFLLPPILFVLIGGLVYIGYRLDAVRHAEIRAELDVMDRSRSNPPALEDRHTVMPDAAHPTTSPRADR